MFYKVALAFSLGCVQVSGVYAEELLIGGSGTDLGTMRLMAERFTHQNPGVSVKVIPSLGSSGGVKAVAKGRLHIGLASRALKAKEQKFPVSAYLYAKTPMVMATHPDNPATGISSQTLLTALTGENSYWPNGQLIRLVLRPANDSDTLLIKQVYPQMAAAYSRAYQLRGVPVAQSDQDSAEEISRIRGSLGSSTLALIYGEQRSIKPLSLDGVAPTLKNVIDERYPLVKELYLVLPASPDTATLGFLRFMRTPEGVALLESTGHVPVAFDPE